MNDFEDRKLGTKHLNLAVAEAAVAKQNILGDRPLKTNFSWQSVVFYCERISQVVNVAVIGMMVLEGCLVVTRWPQKKKTRVGERHIGDSEFTGPRAALVDLRCNFLCCVQNY